MDKVTNHQDALYNTACEQCGCKLYWTADFDADGTEWFSECCDQRYVITIETVNVWSYSLSEGN